MKIGRIKYKVFTDKETGKELWMIYSGLYDFEDEEFYGVGEYGCYWSESVNDGSNGYNLTFSSGYVNPQHADYRRSGFPVRCVVQ